MNILRFVEVATDCTKALNLDKKVSICRICYGPIVVGQYYDAFHCHVNVHAALSSVLLMVGWICSVSKLI